MENKNHHTLVQFAETDFFRGKWHFIDNERRGGYIGDFFTGRYPFF